MLLSTMLSCLLCISAMLYELLDWQVGKAALFSIITTVNLCVLIMCKVVLVSVISISISFQYLALVLSSQLLVLTSYLCADYFLHVPFICFDWWAFPLVIFLFLAVAFFFFHLPQRSSFIFDVNMVLWCWIPLLLLVCKPFDFSDKSERKLCWAHYSWLLFLGFHHLKYIMLLTSGLQNVCWKTS